MRTNESLLEDPSATTGCLSLSQNGSITCDSLHTEASTEDGSLLPPWMLVIIMIGYFLALIIIVGGNGLIIYGVARFRALQYFANIFVAVLACVDLSCAGTIILAMIEIFFRKKFSGFGFRTCQFRMIFGVSHYMASGLSLLGKFERVIMVRPGTPFTNNGYIDNNVCTWVTNCFSANEKVIFVFISPSC